MRLDMLLHQLPSHSRLQCGLSAGLADRVSNDPENKEAANPGHENQLAESFDISVEDHAKADQTEQDDRDPQVDRPRDSKREFSFAHGAPKLFLASSALAGLLKRPGRPDSQSN